MRSVMDTLSMKGGVMKHSKWAVAFVLLFVACSMHGVRCPMAGDWYSTIDDVKVLLELTCVDGTATGMLKLLEDPDGELHAGAELPIIEGDCSNKTVRFLVDVDQNGIKSDEDVYMDLKLEGNVLVGSGHEVDDPDDIHEITFTR